MNKVNGSLTSQRLIKSCDLLLHVMFHILDIDECESASPPACEDPKICINTRGGFQCVCEGTQYGKECQHSKSGLELVGL